MSNRTENFKKAIDYLVMPGLNLREIVVEIAKKNPAVFCRAVEETKYPAAKWRKEVEDLLRAKRKINAIKLFREMTGQGLKEAKAAIDFFEEYGEWRIA